MPTILELENLIQELEGVGAPSAASPGKIESLELCRRLEVDSDAVDRSKRVKWPATNDMRRASALIRLLLQDAARLKYGLTLISEGAWGSHKGENDWNMTNVGRVADELLRSSLAAATREAGTPNEFSQERKD